MRKIPEKVQNIIFSILNCLQAFFKKIYTYILNKQQINQLQQQQKLNSHIICVYYEPGNLIWYLKKYISRFKEETKKLIELCNKIAAIII